MTPSTTRTKPPLVSTSCPRKCTLKIRRSSWTCGTLLARSDSKVWFHHTLKIVRSPLSATMLPPVSLSPALTSGSRMLVPSAMTMSSWFLRATNATWKTVDRYQLKKVRSMHSVWTCFSLRPRRRLDKTSRFYSTSSQRNLQASKPIQSLTIMTRRRPKAFS